MPRLRKSRRLGPGARIGIAAPAFAIGAEQIEKGEAMLRGLGFAVQHRSDLTKRCGYLAGDDARRSNELMELVRDDRVDGILCARGGYGCHRIMADLDAARVRAAAKPLIGFSDVTTLLLWQRRVAGLMGFHGPMLEDESGWNEQERESLLDCLAGRPQQPLCGTPGGGGVAEGRLLGGSLTLLAASLGTPWELQTRGAILLLEDIGEKPYAIDRLLHQLRAARKLDGLAGVGVGHLVGCTDPKRDQPTAEEVVSEILGGLGVPFVRGLPFGHARPNLTWPVGARARLDGERGELRLLEAGVARA